MPDLSSTLPTSTVLRVSVRNSLIPLNGVVMSTSEPVKKRMDGVHALLIRQGVNEGEPTVVTPADWI